MSHITKLLVGISSKDKLLKILSAMGYSVVDERKTIRAHGSSQTEVDMYLKEVPSVGFVLKDGQYHVEGEFYQTGVSPRDFERQIQAESTLDEVLHRAKSYGWIPDMKTMQKDRGKISVELVGTF